MIYLITFELYPTRVFSSHVQVTLNRFISLQLPPNLFEIIKGSNHRIKDHKCTSLLLVISKI